jgi:hypothetical protein
LGLEKYQSIEKKEKKDSNNEFINLPIDWKRLKEKVNLFIILTTIQKDTFGWHWFKNSKI